MKSLCVVLTIALIANAVGQNKIVVTQYESDSQVQINSRTNIDSSCYINFWLEYEMQNDASASISVRGVDFFIPDEFGLSGRYGGWVGTYAMVKINGNYISLYDRSDLRNIVIPNPSYYKVLCTLVIYYTNDVYYTLNPYFDLMKKNKQNSLEIGTLREFRTRHPQVVERLLKNDSVCFTIYDVKNKHAEYITLPIKY